MRLCDEETLRQEGWETLLFLNFMASIGCYWYLDDAPYDVF